VVGLIGKCPTHVPPLSGLTLMVSVCLHGHKPTSHNYCPDEACVCWPAISMANLSLQVTAVNILRTSYIARNALSATRPTYMSGFLQKYFIKILDIKFGVPHTPHTRANICLSCSIQSCGAEDFRIQDKYVRHISVVLRRISEVFPSAVTLALSEIPFDDQTRFAKRDASKH